MIDLTPVHGDAAASSFGTVHNARSIAISAGDLSAAVRDEVRRVLAGSKGDQLDALETVIKRLQDDGYINAQESQMLSRVCRLVLESTGRKDADEATQAAIETSRIYRRLVVNPTASPVALAVASLANSTFLVSEDGGDADGDNTVAGFGPIPTSRGENTSNGVLIGGVLGGFAGAVVGGTVGSAVGAVVGSVVGGAIGAATEGDGEVPPGDGDGDGDGDG